MIEPKPLASLSSGLLARKGQAKPAMRPQGYASFKLASTTYENQHHHDDLGWNDMGHEAGHEGEVVAMNGEAVVETIEPPAVVKQQHELAREIEAVAEAFSVEQPDMAEPLPAALAMPIARAAAGSRGKAAFTLRLDGDRHLKLRLVCAVMHRSAQQIVTQALDEFLAGQPAIADLATSKLKRS
jgi:hypothetical protein